MTEEILREYNASRSCLDKSKLCWAPYRSMYFARNGDVMACCYSRLHPLGKFPEQSIREIWWGESVKEMREQTTKTQLPEACSLCVNQLNASNFEGAIAKYFDRFADTSPRRGPLGKAIRKASGYLPSKWVYPKLMEFELSNTCNLECVMCSGDYSSSIRKNREKLPPLEDVYGDSFMEQLEEFLPHLKMAKFIGGEPFLIPIYYEIWDRLIEVNPDCTIDVTTNGTILNKRVKRVLEKLSGNIILSVDSFDPETYRKIRKRAELDKVMEFMDYFSHEDRKGKNSLWAAICPMPLNMREIPSMLRFCNERDIMLFFNTVVWPKEHSLLYLGASTLKGLKEFYEAELQTFPENGYKQAENKKRFASLINHVSGALEKALNRESISK